MLLPVPSRLDKLADMKYANFTSYIEVENLLPTEFLMNQSYCDQLMTVGVPYLKIKDSVKSKVWRKACSLSPTEFEDFIPLFQTVQKLLRSKH